MIPPTISIETPLNNDVRGLIANLNAHLLPLSPEEFQFKLTAEQMAEDKVSVFVARMAAGEAVGLGALKQHTGDLGEVKRMYILPQMRGKRIGASLLGAIIARARTLGIKQLVLETGVASGFDAARRLYEQHGFEQCAAVLDYPDSGHSAFYRLDLMPTQACG